jgi:predicted phosphodiesterase
MKDNFPDVTEILCPGDLVGYYAQPLEVVEAILANKKVTAVTKGNWDHAIGGGGHDLENIDQYIANFNPIAQVSVRWQVDLLSAEIKKFLYQLPHTRTCLHASHDNTQIALIHGSPNYPLSEYILYGTEAQKALFPFMELIEVNILLLGHTHIPFIDKHPEEKLLIMNPGSVGQPRDKDPRASYAVIDLKNFQAKIVRVKYDIDKVNKQIIDAGLPEFLGKRLYKGI